MDLKTRTKILLAFVLVMAAIGSYFYLGLVHGIYQRVPLGPFAAATVGVVFLAAAAWKTRSRAAWALTLSGAFLTGAFAWFTLSYAVYGSQGKLRPGDRIEVDVELRDAAGAPFDFEDEIRRAPATVLVFYRGFW